MKSTAKPKIVMLGCGNLAWHIAVRLVSLKKFEIHVYNHHSNNALDKFKTKLNCFTHGNLSKIISDADYYLLCVPDKFIGTISKKIKPEKPSAIIAHTSGSIAIDELNKNCTNKAVFYPLQTFSIRDEIDWADVPIMVEGNNEYSFKKIKALALLFSKRIIELNSSARIKLHLAAVLVNNFTNALYTEADNFISEEIKSDTINFKLLLPLINQTALKLKSMSPAEAQTGPAKRSDKKVIKQHLKIIKDKDVKKLYKQFSLLIKKQVQKTPSKRP